MGRASGYVVVLSKDRMATFLECFNESQTFSEPVIDFQHSRNVPLICFMVYGGKISHIALGSRGHRAGTDLRRLNLNKPEQLPRPLSVNRILKLVPKRNLTSAKNRFSSGGLLTDKGFAAIVEAVRALSPQMSSFLEMYNNDRYERINRLTPKVRENLAYQKEAILTALSISGMDREPIQKWNPQGDTPISFLDGLPTARLREDPMVTHDLVNLPGHEIIKELPYLAVVFESDSERLTVILANRLPLEEQTGTDLIYYNETFQSFVMVQYKAMESDVRGRGATEALFRLPNSQLTQEISRMDTLLEELRACPSDTSCDGFRLTENPFFLKLCPRLVFNPDDIGLIPGMYLPLEYWKLLEQHPRIQGPMGGRHVSYKNIGRYFDNTSFTMVVAKAWVGTTPNQSMVLREAIRQTLEAGKAVAVAVKAKTQAIQMID